MKDVTMILRTFYLKQLKTQNMIRRILQLIVVVLFTTQGVMAQVVDIDDVIDKSPGLVEVGVNMSNFNNIGAITLYIEYDENLMGYIGIDYNSSLYPGIWTDYGSDGLITITYVNPNGVTITNPETVFNLLFNYNGSFTGDLLFFDTINKFNEIANTSGATITTTFLDGSVTPTTTVAGTVSMTNEQPQVGATVNMPVDFSSTGTGFDAVNAITLKMAYDETQLTYSTVTSTLTGFVPSSGSGVVSITWAGTVQDLSDADGVFNVQFIYNGGNADVEFVPGCEIANSGTSLATAYTGAIISPASAAASLTIGNATAMPAGLVPTVVNLPITAAGFGTTTMGAITFKINYDNSEAVYTGYTADQLSGWVVSGNSSGEITMNWSNATGATIADGNLVTLNFNTDTIHGKDLVTFSPGTILTDDASASVPVGLNDGYIVNYTASFTFVDDSGNDVDGVSIDFNDVIYNPADADIIFYGLDDGTYAYTVTKTGYGDVTGSVTIAGGDVVETVVLYPDLFANVKVYLQGAYNSTTGMMNTTIHEYLPTTQPYSVDPWNYSGTENVDPIPTNVVDWVLIELRSDVTAASVVSTRAAFVLADGSIVDLDGTSQLKFSGISAGNYYIVIKHRFHLAIMSATAQALSGTSALYDFTTSESQSYGVNALMDFGDGNWGLYSGDGNADGVIFPTDVTLVYLTQANQSGYKTADWNMDGIVFPTDVTLIYLGNANKSTKVPN